jgi:hypothetical protein
MKILIDNICVITFIWEKFGGEKKKKAENDV